MKIYLCRKCNQTIPVDALTEHRVACGPDAEITLQGGRKGRVLRVVRNIFLGILGLGLVGVGIWLGRSSFVSLARMRQLERVPATVVQAVLPGEINLTGSAVAATDTLKGPKSGATCLYYRYLVEREERDSDGDTTWVTVSDESAQVPFRLQDASGQILVRPHSQVDFNMPREFRRRSGRYRYTEWRLDPGRQVFVFGYVEPTGGGYEVRFRRQGQYVPIISQHGESRERLNMAAWSIGKCWGGLVALAFAVGLFSFLLGIHRLLVYFSILGLVVMLDLSVLGLKMLKADLRGAVQRLAQHEQTAQTVLLEELGRAGVRWDGQWASLGSLEVAARSAGLDQRAVERLVRIRVDLALAVRRVRQQRAGFPERLLAPLWRIPKPGPLPLPDERLAEVDALAAQFAVARVPKAVGGAIAGGAVLLAAVTFLFGFKKVRFKRCIENVPTSPAAGAVYGLSEFKGIVTLPTQEEPLLGPLTTLTCIQYHYWIKERRGSGKNARWVTIHDETDQRPFLCEDGSGTILIDPAEARVITAHKTSHREGRRRYTETRLELGDPLYAIGECAIEPGQADALYVRKPEDDAPFILSNEPEAAVMRRMAATGIVFLNLSFAALLLTGLVLFGMSGAFGATDYLAAALVAPFFMALVTLVLHFNDLVFLRERVRRNWANIDVSLQKRHDLIPNLEQMVKAYMTHEAEVQETLTAMRSAYDATTSAQPDSVDRYMATEQAALHRVLASFEDYPELKANRQAALLMRTLVLLENEISFMRTGYNTAVETYNTRIESVPDVFFARGFGFASAPFLQAESEVVRVPPSIQAVWEREQVGGAPDGGADSDAVPPAAPAAGGPTVTGAAAPTVLAATARGTPDAAQRQAEDLSPDATDGRAVIYALLLSAEEAVCKAQLDAISEIDAEAVREKTASLRDAVGQQIEDDVSRVCEAEKWFGKIETLSLSGYRSFKAIVRKLMEQDAEITLFEYALQKSITRRLDRAFGMTRAVAVRHQSLETLMPQAAVMLSCLAYGEETPQETAQAAFDAGVAMLNLPAGSTLAMAPREECTVAAFDAALDEVCHGAKMIQANVQYACEAAVKLNEDYTYDQALLLMAVADAFERERPDWLVPEGD